MSQHELKTLEVLEITDAVFQNPFLRPKVIIYVSYLNCSKLLFVGIKKLVVEFCVNLLLFYYLRVTFLNKSHKFAGWWFWNQWSHERDHLLPTNIRQVATSHYNPSRGAVQLRNSRSAQRPVRGGRLLQPVLTGLFSCTSQSLIRHALPIHL